MNREPAESAAQRERSASRLPDPGTSPGEQQPRAQTASFAALAKRVARWATNLLATGLILIGGIVFGRQAIIWWSAAEAPRHNHVAEVVGPPAVSSLGATQLLEFGDFPFLLQRSTLEGDVGQALDRLRASCRAAANAARTVHRRPGPAERRMLAGTRELEPVEQVAGRWRMYQLAAPLPMVVAVMDGAPENAAPETMHRQGSNRQVAAVDGCVVSWGLALPVAAEATRVPGHWTLFTYTPDAATAGSSVELPVPAGGRRTVLLQSESGGALVGIRGQGDVGRWMQFYDRQLPAAGFQATAGWLRNEPVWQRRYTSPRMGSLDVQLMVAEDGSLNGLLLTAPPAGAAAERQD